MKRSYFNMRNMNSYKKTCSIITHLRKPYNKAYGLGQRGGLDKKSFNITY